MILGIGTDITEISRIKHLCSNTKFLEKHFTSQEIDYIKDKYNSAAAIFAAKEAYSKALGTGFRMISLKDIEIFHDNLGKPYIKAYNNAYIDNTEIFLSLSHCDEYAVAYVVIEKRG